MNQCLLGEYGSWKQPDLIIGVDHFKFISLEKTQVTNLGFSLINTIVGSMIARSGHIERQLNQFDEKLEDPSETLTYNECCDIQEKNQTNVMPLNDEIPEIDRFWKLEFIDIQEQPNQINDGEALK